MILIQGIDISILYIIEILILSLTQQCVYVFQCTMNRADATVLFQAGHGLSL
jgi:hypothetical protein